MRLKKYISAIVLPFLLFALAFGEPGKMTKFDRVIVLDATTYTGIIVEETDSKIIMSIKDEMYEINKDFVYAIIYRDGTVKKFESGAEGAEGVQEAPLGIMNYILGAAILFLALYYGAYGW